MPAALTFDPSSFKKSFKLPAGKVFRRKDIAGQNPSIDRALGRFVHSGVVCKAAQGLYYVPKKRLLVPLCLMKTRWWLNFWTTSNF